MNETPSVLVVDDDQSICKSLTLIFENLGYDIETVGTAQGAMEKAVKIFEAGCTRFPDAPAFSGERGEALKQELRELKMLYVENVERTWDGRPSGFAQPKEYPP